MPNKIIAASLQVETQQAEQSVKSVKRELREANEELVRLQREFGRTSEPAIAAARRVAELRDSIQDARETAELFDPGKRMQAFTNATRAAVGGLSALTGAAALFGSQGEDLQKTLVKIQGAMAFSEGVSTLLDAGKNFEELKIVAVSSLQAIKAAIGATGIGLIVIALAAVVMYWDQIKEAVSGVSEEQERNLEVTKQAAAKEKEKLDHMGDQDNLLKLQGKSELNILKLKEAQYQTTIAAAEAQMEAQGQVAKAQIETAARNQEILQGILTFVSLPLELITKTIDEAGKLIGKDWKLNDKLNKGIKSVASMLFDPDDVKAQADKTHKESLDYLNKLKNDAAGLQLQIQGINKDSYKERLDQEKTFQDELRKVKQAAEDLEIKDEKMREFKRIEREREAQLRSVSEMKISKEQQKELIKNYNELYAAQDAARLRDYNALQDKSFKDNFENYIKAQSQLKKTKAEENLDEMTQMQNAHDVLQEIDNTYYFEKSQQIDQWQAQELEKAGDNEQAKTAVMKEAADMRARLEVEVENQKLGVISGLLGQGVKLLGQHTAAGKALAIAQAVIDTKAGMTSALSSKAAPFAEPWATITRFTSAGLIGIAGAKNVADILKTTIPGVGSGGGGAIGSLSVPMVPPVVQQPTIMKTMLDQQSINGIGNAAAGGVNGTFTNMTVKAVVVESEVTATQDRIAKLNRMARLGGE